MGEVNHKLVKVVLTGTDLPFTLTNGASVVGIFCPASISSTTATIQASMDGGSTFVSVYDVGGASAYSLTVGASRFIPIDPRVTAGFHIGKVVMGSSETAKTFYLACRELA